MLIQHSTLVTVSFLCVDIRSRRLDEADTFALRYILERLGPHSPSGCAVPLKVRANLPLFKGTKE